MIKTCRREDIVAKRKVYAPTNQAQVTICSQGEEGNQTAPIELGDSEQDEEDCQTGYLMVNNHVDYEKLREENKMLDQEIENVKSGKKSNLARSLNLLPQVVDIIEDEPSAVKKKDEIPMVPLDDPTKKVNGTLMGLNFVITGIFNNLTRVQMEDLVRKNKGRVQSSLSRNTNFLVYGEYLEDGRKASEGKKY